MQTRPALIYENEALDLLDNIIDVPARRVIILEGRHYSPVTGTSAGYGSSGVNQYASVNSEANKISQSTKFFITSNKAVEERWHLSECAVELLFTDCSPVGSMNVTYGEKVVQ